MLDWLDKLAPEADKPTGQAEPPIHETQSDSVLPAVRPDEAEDGKSLPANEAEGQGCIPLLSLALGELLKQVAPRVMPGELADLRAQAEAEPDRVVALCAWVLSAPSSPTEEDLAELDRLIVELCGLVGWLQGQEAGLLAVRRRMAPARVAGDLVQFPRWIKAIRAKGDNEARMAGSCRKPPCAGTLPDLTR